MHLTQSLPDSPAGPVPANGMGPPAGCYFAFGLKFRSELPLPEFVRLPDGESGIDSVIVFGSGDDWIPQVRDHPTSWYLDSADARFWFRGVAGFRVRDGSRIVITPEPGVDDALLRMYVEGMIVAVLLYQRGFFVLHASVVRLGLTSVAFLGHVGAGKSSTAAALHARGHAVLTDDNAAVDSSGPQPCVLPAFPCIKVFPAIAASLGYASDSLHLMHSSQPKCARPLTGAFPGNPVPLSAIYVLDRETDRLISRLSRAETVIELVRNSVPTRWKLQGGAHHLQRCAALAGQVPAYRVRTFHQLSELPDLARRIEIHQAESGNV